MIDRDKLPRWPDSVAGGSLAQGSSHRNAQNSAWLAPLLLGPGLECWQKDGYCASAGVSA